jgi:hypothetical protein
MSSVSRHRFSLSLSTRLGVHNAYIRGTIEASIFCRPSSVNSFGSNDVGNSDASAKGEAVVVVVFDSDGVLELAIQSNMHTMWSSH